MASGLNASRILIYGVTGSGKSTLAEKLASKTGIPWHSVDDLTFEADWVAVEPDEQRRRIQDICGSPEWILDSAYGAWIQIPLEKAELIIALDYPRWVSLSRLVVRTFARLIKKTAVCNGNYETLNKTLSTDSIIVWHFKSFARKRARMRAWSSSGEGPTVLRFETPRELEKWLSSFSA